MKHTDSRSLPDWIEDVYEVLAAEPDERREGIARERAIELLCGHDSLPDDPSDMEYAIDRLVEYGWLYEVHGDVRITDPD